MHESTGRPKVHRWSVWWPMDSLGFTENLLKWKWLDDSEDALIKCPLCLSKTRTTFGPFWAFFDWLHGLSRLLIGGLPRTETDNPTINHSWSVRRAKILNFLQHWINRQILIHSSFKQVQKSGSAFYQDVRRYWFYQKRLLSQCARLLFQHFHCQNMELIKQIVWSFH